MIDGTPFVIFSLPRSRSYWLSRFLTYGDYTCGHEQARFVRAPDDVRSWLAQGYTGTAETGAAPWYRLGRLLRPDLRIVVVRRPAAEVVESLMRLDMRGVCEFDRARLKQQIARLDKRLDRISRMPGVLTVQYADLEQEATCAAVFEHCLGYKHDPAWWARLTPVNLQCNLPSLMRYMLLNQAQIGRAAAGCTAQLKRLVRRCPESEPGPDGLVMAESRMAEFVQDAQALFAEHCTAVGEPADQHLRKNIPLFRRMEDLGALHIMTARMNGRLFGYLVSLLSPCLENPGDILATQTLFFACEDAKGLRLGMRMQQASIEALRAKGVAAVAMRAGVRGAGPKMGVLYRRLGAEDYGHLYKLYLKAA